MGVTEEGFAGAGVAGRKHHPIGIEPKPQDLAHGQETVVLRARHFGRAQSQSRLHQAVEVSRHQAVVIDPLSNTHHPRAKHKIAGGKHGPDAEDGPPGPARHPCNTGR